MAVTVPALVLDKLSREERLALAQELWDSIAAEGPDNCI
jgi:putative addiction module component (TIGR02574 family)